MSAESYRQEIAGRLAIFLDADVQKIYYENSPRGKFFYRIDRRSIVVEVKGPRYIRVCGIVCKSEESARTRIEGHRDFVHALDSGVARHVDSTPSTRVRAS